MRYDPITLLEGIATAEEFEQQLGGIIKRYGVDFTASVMDRHVQKRLMASGHQISKQEVTSYVEKIAEGLNNVHRK